MSSLSFGIFRFLQLAKYIMVVGGLQSALLRNLGSDRLHLVTCRGENEERTIYQLVRFHIDAEILQIVGVDFRGKAIGLACSRNHRGGHPFGIGIELL